MHCKLLPFVFVFVCASTFAQGFLGKPKNDVMKAYAQCEQLAGYKTEVLFKCEGHKALFYFTEKDSVCDLWAMDLFPQQANDTLQQILKNGFQKVGSNYVEAFLKSKKNPNHQKFPVRIYSNGLAQYNFMPVSLNGNSAELNSLIVTYKKK